MSVCSLFLHPLASTVPPSSSLFLSPSIFRLFALKFIADDSKLIVKLIFSFLLSYPLAALLKRVPDTRPDYKNLFIIRYDELKVSKRRECDHTNSYS